MTFFILSAIVANVAWLFHEHWRSMAELAEGWDTTMLDRHRERLLEAHRRSPHPLIRLYIRQNVQIALRYRRYADGHWQSIPTFVRHFYKRNKNVR